MPHRLPLHRMAVALSRGGDEADALMQACAAERAGSSREAETGRTG